ncbi:MAG TPA: porin [Lacipirellulaceae bacterium]|nr:porin [Lacipirellulaceae bacterium]HMP05401.1 porin [Lacipirellulaceae bacterium]
MWTSTAGDGGSFETSEGRFTDPTAPAALASPSSVEHTTTLAAMQQLLDGYSPGIYGPGDVQDAPGAPDYVPRYSRRERPIPDYLFSPGYYNTYGVGARPLADYAPPGFEPRDYQDAPGMREYRPVTPPVRPGTDDPGNEVIRGMYPGSFLVPGTNTSFRLRGFVRLASMLDLAPMGVADAFVPSTIPVPQEVGQNFSMSGRISRFALESWTPIDYCQWNVHTFIEGDFFNGAPQAAGGGGNPFRLRHAFLDVGYFRFGQQNSTFMDPNNWPSLVDFQGPNGWINQRQPSARVTIPVVDQLYWAASVERPFADITTNDLGTSVQDVPDFANHLRYQGDLGHLQIATLLRTLGYRPAGGDVTRRNGVGVSGSAVLHPWAILLGGNPVREEDPSGLTLSRILMQYTWGPGTARYVNDLVGQGLDAQVNPITGEFGLVDATAWNVSYEHWFNEQWLTNFTYSEARASSGADQPGTTYDAGRYVANSLWWIPRPRLSFGIEYLWGKRANIDGQSAEARRLHALAQYNF